MFSATAIEEHIDDCDERLCPLITELVKLAEEADRLLRANANTRDAAIQRLENAVEEVSLAV